MNKTLFGFEAGAEQHRAGFFASERPAAWFHSRAAAERFADWARWWHPGFNRGAILERDNPGAGIMDCPERPWQPPGTAARLLLKSNPLVTGQAFCRLCVRTFAPGDVVSWVTTPACPSAPVHWECAGSIGGALAPDPLIGRPADARA